jgi:hypothetical protein
MLAAFDTDFTRGTCLGGRISYSDGPGSLFSSMAIFGMERTGYAEAASLRMARTLRIGWQRYSPIVNETAAKLPSCERVGGPLCAFGSLTCRNSAIWQPDR